MSQALRWSYLVSELLDFICAGASTVRWVINVCGRVNYHSTHPTHTALGLGSCLFYLTHKSPLRRPQSTSESNYCRVTQILSTFKDSSGSYLPQLLHNLCSGDLGHCWGLRDEPYALSATALGAGGLTTRDLLNSWFRSASSAASTRF